MSKKLLFLISFSILVLTLAGSASAQTWPAAYWSVLAMTPAVGTIRTTGGQLKRMRMSRVFPRLEKRKST